MRCLAVCHSEFVVRLLDDVLRPSFDVDILVDSRTLARRLHEADITATAADLRRTDTYLKADISPLTCVVVEDTGRRGLRTIVEAARNAGATLIYVLGAGLNASTAARRQDEIKAVFPDVYYLTISEIAGGPFVTEINRSLTRARVQQYQRFLSDADRILILLHNEPDPDALASGLALRNLLRRTKATAIIGALRGVTRPENLRMINMLDIHVEQITPQMLGEFDRIAMVDVQPHYFGDVISRADLVIDHHPPQAGYSAIYRDIRPDYGSTASILTEYLRSVDVSISERTATALLYAIKSDTLFFNRQASRVDLEAFSFLYPLADAALIRKMEGAEITLERLAYVATALQSALVTDQIFCAFLGGAPREDFIPYVADFFLQVEDVKWTIVAGVVDDALVISVRNLGYSRNAGEFVKKWFADIGSAGGHRAMAKAVVPLAAFRGRFGDLTGSQINEKLHELAIQFLREHAPPDKRKEVVRA
jgi:nanoRNase/pAp phosphatase (c-di-AMP/oligoRNAs hydrolase)